MFLCLASGFTWHCPRLFASMDPAVTAKMQAMRFLFFRFNHTRYYHGLSILVHDLFICLVPAVFQDSALQACLVWIVLCIYVLVQQ